VEYERVGRPGIWVLGGEAEAEVVKELVKRVVDPRVELVEGAAAVIREKNVVGDRLDSGCTEWGVHAVEELKEEDADPEAVRGQAVGLGFRHFDDQVLGAQFGQVVAQLSQAIRGGGHAEGIGGSLMQVTCTETPAAAQMDEAGQRLHDRQQAWVVELQAGCPTSARGDRWLPQAG